MEQKTRKQAASDGDVNYWTGKACGRGHLAPRYVSTGLCCECAAAHSKNYARSLKIAKNTKLFGPPLISEIRLEVPTTSLAAVQSLARALVAKDPRAVNLLALWSLHS